MHDKFKPQRLLIDQAHPGQLLLHAALGGIRTYDLPLDTQLLRKNAVCSMDDIPIDVGMVISCLNSYMKGREVKWANLTQNEVWEMVQISQIRIKK